MIETKYGNKIWKSNKLNVKVSDMSDEHINKCISYLNKKLNSALKRERPWCYEWLDIFRTEIKEREKDKNRIRFELNPENPKVVLNIGLTRIPKNCTECPFYINNTEYDEDSSFGDGYTHSCPFGCGIWGCAIERPTDCPIQEVNKEGK